MRRSRESSASERQKYFHNQRRKTVIQGLSPMSFKILRPHVILSEAKNLNYWLRINSVKNLTSAQDKLREESSHFFAGFFISSTKTTATTQVAAASTKELV